MTPKIVILHYHLQPGGVTGVIRHQVNALKNDCDMLLLTGEDPRDPFDAPIKVVKGIGYDRSEESPADPRKTALQILDAIEQKFPGGCDLLHVHNPLLAKNRQFLNILSILSDMGVSLFLQIHDFAEDGRPEVYFKDAPYPAACHYGVINSRDFQIMADAGVAEERLHLTPNMVAPFDLVPEKTISPAYMLYPVRAIRRKNIGEALLLSRFFPKEQVLSITLPPNSPHDWIRYAEWKTYALRNRLNVRFEASRFHDFTDLVRSADAVITTSITEGFGFGFLEPWTARQILFGRRLPGVCSDFEQQGLRLDHLYDRLEVPLDWISADLFFHQWKKCILLNAERFGIDVSEINIHAVAERIRMRGTIDFGLLSEQHQKQVISSLLADAGLKDRMHLLNPKLEEWADPDRMKEIIAHNNEKVRKTYGISAYRTRLLKIYRSVSADAPRHPIDKQKIARAFLRPDTFSLLAWSDHGH